MKKVAAVKASRKELLVEEKEKQWYIPPTNGIPTYKAEKDPNCPVGRMGNYNRRQKQKIGEIPDTQQTAAWIKQKLDRKYEDVPIRVHANLSTKALEEAGVQYNGSNAHRASPAEVEILQRILVRERLLTELTRLLRSASSDMHAILGEAVELIKAIRFETIDIVEDIAAWQQVQPTPRPFLFKGMNYLIKISCDLDFLDNYDELVERFCFEFKANPFAYKGGGNVITGAGPKNSEHYLQSLLNSYYDGGHQNVDGVEVVRLHNAEKIIQGEFNRLAAQGNIQLSSSTNSIPDALQLMTQSIELNDGPLLHSTSSPDFNYGNTNSSANNNSNSSSNNKHASPARPTSSSGRGKKPVVFSAKKLKLERIATLQSEVDALLAVSAHLTEKIQTLSEHYRGDHKAYRVVESKMIEARNAQKEAAMQHCAAELVVRKSRLVDMSNQIKDLQREVYFVGLEKKRKSGVIRTLKNELNEEKRTLALKKQIEDTIKKHGLTAALDLINLQKEQQQQQQAQKQATLQLPTASSSSSSKKSSSKKGKKAKIQLSLAASQSDKLPPIVQGNSHGVPASSTTKMKQRRQSPSGDDEGVVETDTSREQTEEDDEEDEEEEDESEEEEEDEEGDTGEDASADGIFLQHQPSSTSKASPSYLNPQLRRHGSVESIAEGGEEEEEEDGDEEEGEGEEEGEEEEEGAVVINQQEPQAALEQYEQQLKVFSQQQHQQHQSTEELSKEEGDHRMALQEGSMKDNIQRLLQQQKAENANHSNYISDDEGDGDDGEGDQDRVHEYANQTAQYALTGASDAGEDDGEQSELEVSADFSTVSGIPAGAGYKVAKALAAGGK